MKVFLRESQGSVQDLNGSQKLGVLYESLEVKLKAG